MHRSALDIAYPASRRAPLRRLLASSLVVSYLAAACRPAPASPRSAAAPPPAAESPDDPFALVAALGRLDGADLWPGFDPGAIPIAIYDGRRTLLFRHPAPPDGFDPVAGGASVFAWPGRHPSVTANSSAEIGAAQTATVVPGRAHDAPVARLALVVHEMFHVHQRLRHPGWSANEVELFTYPVADARLLALRRLESAALRGALAASSDEAAACRAGSAMALRRERYGSLTPGAIRWERGTELNEGLADYVAHRATATPDTAIIPRDAFRADEPRRRAYASGAAIGRLLDRLDPEWRATVERRDSTAGDATPLDSLLAAAAGRADAAGAAARCAPDEDARASALREAMRDVESLRGRLAAERRELLGRPGWRVVFVAQESPLFPRQFDPLNVRVVAPGEVVHSRFVELGNEAGAIRVLGAGALSEAAGEHPLFNGVRRLTVTGLAGEPAVADSAGVLLVRAEGLRAQLRGARITRADHLLTVRLAP